MCATCGCSNSDGTLITDLATGQHAHLAEGSAPGGFEAHAEFHSHDQAGGDHHHDHHHSRHSHSEETTAPPLNDHHSHGGGHTHSHHGHSTPALSRTIQLETELLRRNSQLAERNRGWFEGRDILAVNVMSAPGSGKTALLERTIREMAGELQIQVIEGDQETLRDAERIRALGTPVIQVNTGAACHLDAAMVSVAARKLNSPPGSTLFIENVGNLVCPALFDLGERVRVVITAVTEGEDKPSKYPHMFRSANLIVLNKMDLLPHVEFDLDRFLGLARNLNPQAPVVQVSATGGQGMENWYEALRRWRG
jgi:hydrogenase nickel incorporation protein HypB